MLFDKCKFKVQWDIQVKNDIQETLGKKKKKETLENVMLELRLIII